MPEILAEDFKDVAPMQFEATEDIDGKISVKPIIERKGEDLIIHLPSLSLINKLSTDKQKQNDKRNIQQIQSELNE